MTLVRHGSLEVDARLDEDRWIIRRGGITTSAHNL